MSRLTKATIIPIIIFLVLNINGCSKNKKAKFENQEQTISQPIYNIDYYKQMEIMDNYIEAYFYIIENNLYNLNKFENIEDENLFKNSFIISNLCYYAEGDKVDVLNELNTIRNVNVLNASLDINVIKNKFPITYKLHKNTDDFLQYYEDISNKLCKENTKEMTYTRI